jgi:hypothetical protein
MSVIRSLVVENRLYDLLEWASQGLVDGPKRDFPPAAGRLEGRFTNAHGRHKPVHVPLLSRCHYRGANRR